MDMWMYGCMDGGRGVLMMDQVFTVSRVGNGVGKDGRMEKAEELGMGLYISNTGFFPSRTHLVNYCQTYVAPMA